jgi:hypothetical protein
MRFGPTSKRAFITLVFVALLGLGACGAVGPNGGNQSERYSDGGTNRLADFVDNRRVALEPIRWGIMAVTDRSVEVGALVPYCEYTKPKPRVKRVERKRQRGGFVLTMFVWFPPKRVGPNAGGCLGAEVGVSRWVKLGRKVEQVRLYDGSTSPPSLRQSRLG